jgi:hypothetical protein
LGSCKGSRFLLDHFADAFNSWTSSNTATPDIGLVLGSSTPIRITSASLQPTTTTTTANTPARVSHTPRQSSTTLPPITPARQSLPLPPDPHVTPNRSNVSPLNNTSPLMPLHFIRKASESPPVREREKERLKAGRRSILGKEGSQAVFP